MKTRTFKLEKLVRDKIVEIHEDMGGEVDYKVLTGKELVIALIDKLIEEAQELKTSDLSVGEVADLQEVLDAITGELGISDETLAVAQEEKNRKNGGFKLGHFINTVTLPANNKWADYYAADPSRFPEVKTK